MRQPDPVTAESLSVHTHLQIEQGIISRMAENCRQCKLWSVTTIAAILFFAARSSSPEHALIALVPLALLWGLDGYYLGQERAFRRSSAGFVQKLHGGGLTPAELYSWGEKVRWKDWLEGCKAMPCSWFYVPLAITIGLIFGIAEVNPAPLC